MQRIDVCANPGDGAVEGLVERFVGTFRLGHTIDQTPDAIYKPPCALNPAFGPFQIAFRRTVAQHEPADSIGAILVEHRIRIDDILFGFRHFLDAATRNGRTVQHGCDIALYRNIFRR